MAKRKNENFRRIKCSTLAKLLQEQEFDESIYNLNQGDDLKTQDGHSVVNGHHGDTVSQYSVQTGVTQVSAVTYATEQLGITD